MILFTIAFIYFFIRNVRTLNDTHTVEHNDIEDNTTLLIEALEEQQDLISEQLNGGTKKVRRIKNGITTLTEIPLTPDEKSRLLIKLREIDLRLVKLRKKCA